MKVFNPVMGTPGSFSWHNGTGISYLDFLRHFNLLAKP
jgi:hypothetical protein